MSDSNKAQQICNPYNTV